MQTIHAVVCTSCESDGAHVPHAPLVQCESWPSQYMSCYLTLRLHWSLRTGGNIQDCFETRTTNLMCRCATVSVQKLGFTHLGA
jgi:hypothetical protein